MDHLISPIALTIWGYQMSWVELIGTICNIISVYLLTKRKIINWPIGILGSLLFALLFFQFRLYSDFIENIYYIITGFWGWYLWAYSKPATDADIVVRRSGRAELIICTVCIIFGTMIMGYGISHVHIWLPHYFPQAAALPYLDTLTTVMSFVAQILLVRRVILNWYLWIAVDIIGVWLYWYKQLKLISLLYILFLLLATKGLINWRRSYAAQNKKEESYD